MVVVETINMSSFQKGMLRHDQRCKQGKFFVTLFTVAVRDGVARRAFVYIFFYLLIKIDELVCYLLIFVIYDVNFETILVYSY